MGDSFNKKWTVINVVGEVRSYQYSYEYVMKDLFPEKEGANHNLFEIFIFNDKVNLYKFDNSIFETACLKKHTPRFNGYCYNDENEFLLKSSDIPVVDEGKKYYLQARLSSWFPSLISHPGVERSKKISTILQDYSSIIYQQSKTEHYFMFSKGHGGRNDQGIFQENLLHHDAKDFFANFNTMIGHKLDILDFSTNCYLGNFEMLSNYASYTQYFAGNYYGSGGIRAGASTPWDRVPKTIIRGVEQYSLSYEGFFSQILAEGNNLQDVAKRMMEVHELRKTMHERDDYEAMYSSSIFNTQYFNKFTTLLQQQIRAHKNLVDNHDVFEIAKQVNNPELEELFFKLRPFYTTNKEYFTWTEESNGLYTDGIREIMSYHSDVAGSSSVEIDL